MRTVEKIARRRIVEADDTLRRAAESEATRVVPDDPSASPAERRAISARRELYLEWLLNPDSAAETFLNSSRLPSEVNVLLQQYISNHGAQLERALQGRRPASKDTAELDAARAAKNRVEIVSQDKIETGTSGLSAEDFVGYLGLTLAKSGKMGTLSVRELRPVIDELRARNPKFNAAFSWLLGVQPARGFPKTRAGAETSPEDYYA